MCLCVCVCVCVRTRGPHSQGIQLTIINYDRVFGIFWKCARIGERLSPYVSLCCVVMAVRAPPQIKRFDVAAERNLSRRL